MCQSVVPGTTTTDVPALCRHGLSGRPAGDAYQIHAGISGSDPDVDVPNDILSGVFFPLDGLPVWINVLVKINPATYGIAPIRQVMLGTSTESPFAISLLGHAMSIWDNIAVLVIFGAVMTLLAVWSFANQE